MSDEGFFLRGTTWWVRTDPLTGKQESSGCKTRKLRDVWYSHRVAKSVDPNYQIPGQETDGLNTWCAKLIDLKKRRRAEGTASFYEAKLGTLVRVFCTKRDEGEVDAKGKPLPQLMNLGLEVPLDEAFKPSNWDRYMDIRSAEGARPTTILKEINAAKVVANFAARDGGFRGNTKRFKPHDLDNDYKPGKTFLTPDQLLKLMEALSEKSEGRSAAPWQAAHVALSVALATRYSEAFRILPEHVDTKNWTVKIEGTKTDDSDDTIPIAEPFRPLLLLAVSYLPLRPWPNNNQWKALQLACRRAGIPEVTSNDLRRTHASWLTEAGVPDSIVARVMRHADERMVRKVYGRARPDKLGTSIAAYFRSVAELPVSQATATNPQQSPEVNNETSMIYEETAAE